MRYTFLLVFICMSLLASGQSKTERALRLLEKARFEAMTKRDLDALGKMLDPTLTYTHSNGLVESRADHLDHIRSGYIVYRAIRPLEMEMRLYGKTAVGTGVVLVDGRFNGRDFQIKLRYTDVYVKRPGGWKLVAWHSVKVD